MHLQFHCLYPICIWERDEVVSAFIYLSLGHIRKWDTVSWRLSFAFREFECSAFLIFSIFKGIELVLYKDFFIILFLGIATNVCTLCKFRWLNIFYVKTRTIAVLKIWHSVLNRLVMVERELFNKGSLSVVR